MLPRRRTLIAGLTIALAACADQPTGPAASPSGPSLTSASSFGLLECPASESQSATGTVLPLGGTVAVGKTAISLPLAAVTGPTSIALTVPASNYMEVDIRANGLESFVFNRPATVTIDYSRCTRNDINKLKLTVWHINPVTKALLENMNAVDDKANKTVTFTTGHLSGYSVGYGTPLDTTGTGGGT